MAVVPPLKFPLPVEPHASSCGPVQLEQVRKVPLFQGLTEEAAEKLCSLLIAREFKAPARLFNAG